MMSLALRQPIERSMARRLRRMDGVRPACARRRFYALALCATTAMPVPAQAQGRVGATSSSSATRRWLVATAVLVSAFAVDVHVRDAAARWQTPALDRVARAVDPIGRAGVLVPALVIGVAVPRLLGHRALSNDVLRVAAGYVAADAVESVLKPLIGRHRPSDGGGAWRFGPLQRDPEWHSFPSAHTVHAFAIATGLAHESCPAIVGAMGYTAAGLVGLERVYVNAHWTSDVVASTVLATTVSSAMQRLLDVRIGRSEPCDRGQSRTDPDPDSTRQTVSDPKRKGV